MRKVTLFLATLIFVALAGTASAQCISCNWPCTGTLGDNFECNDDGEGDLGSCNNRPNCRGCLGWINQSCIWPQAELQPAPPTPLLGVAHVTAVAVRHDPTPVQTSYQIALAR